MTHEPFETLAAVYAVGALDGDDLTQFEAHLPTCAACQASIRDAHETLTRATLSMPRLAPPAGARAALLRRLADRRDLRPRAWLRWAAATAVAAAVAAMFTGTWVAVRYEARLGRKVVGFSTYRRVDDRVVFIHTETDPAVKGRGVASTLAAGELDDVRRRGLKVTPKCPFIAAYIRRHPAYQDLVVSVENLRQRRSAG